MVAALFLSLALLGQPTAPDQPSSDLTDLTSRATAGEVWAMWLLYRVYGDDMYDDTPPDFELPAGKRPLWNAAVRATKERGHAYTPDESAIWLKRAAEAGNLLATDELAGCYQHGQLGFPKDNAKAFELMRVAIDRGSYVSMVSLASDYEDGTGGQQKDPDQAAKYYAMAVPVLQQHIAAGDVRAKYWLANLYAGGHGGCPKDPARAFQLAKEAAEGGNSAAMSTVARMLLTGQGTNKDHEAALEWTKRGVEHGSPGAMFRLATLIKDEHLSGYKPEDVARWMRRSAERDFAPASHAPGLMCDTGAPGVPQDHERAVHWLSKAADADWDFAAYDLGCWARDGHNQARDLAAAARWFQRAAELGSSDGMLALAAMYERGQEALGRDPAKAASLLQRAADLGSDEAMINLAQLYASGRGVPKDPARARELVRRAAELGNERAKSLLKQWP